jgi:2-dehydro-3-deoxygluconokinase
MGITFKAEGECRWDLLALGEVMLRFDPGDSRVATARSFRVWEGGGEYNVARALRRSFGMRTAIVTALVDNPVGRLIEDLMLQGGVDLSNLSWLPDDGVGRAARNGLNFTERGYGVRAGMGCYDRANTAVSQLAPGSIDWGEVFGPAGAARWFHTGGIFAALSETTPLVAAEAMAAARRGGAVISYDLNYRSSLWRSLGGAERAQAVNRELVGQADVLLGNEEDFGAALGFEAQGGDGDFLNLDPARHGELMQRVAGQFPNLRLIATTLRVAHTASRNDWSAICLEGGRLHQATERQGLEILDRIGGGDAFASGFIFGLLSGHDPAVALEYGAAHGALAMTTPGDTSMATQAEVERLMRGSSGRVVR